MTFGWGEARHLRTPGQGGSAPSGSKRVLEVLWVCGGVEGVGKVLCDVSSFF